MAKVRQFGLVLAFSMFLLVGCAGSKDPAATAVERYLKGMVAGDSSQTSKMACKDFEDQAVKDADSFGGVKAELVQAVCSKSGMQGSAVLVGCVGKISATYGKENQEFELAGPVYSVIQQGGDWLVCGRQ
jgi:hypothetical protein